MVAILNDTMLREDISRHRLAQMVEGQVSRSQVYDVLAAKRTIDLAELDAICGALGLGVADVLLQAQRSPGAHPPQRNQSA